MWEDLLVHLGKLSMGTERYVNTSIVAPHDVVYLFNEYLRREEKNA
jgi:hypothetical protein